MSTNTYKLDDKKIAQMSILTYKLDDKKFLLKVLFMSALSSFFIAQIKYTFDLC